MHVQGTTHIHGSHGINAPHIVRRGQAPSSTMANGTVDRLDISAAAEAAARAADSGEVRQDLVNQIRAQIANGAYETPAKLDAAIERLLDELA